MSEGYFKVYKSAAGSGKTYILVKEYLKLVLKNPKKYSRILAITFTNKAASEMKGRIIDSLSDISKVEEIVQGSLVEDLVAELSMPIELIRNHAQLVLQSILHNYSDFSISTIDSFTHRIVKTFAFDLRMPMAFDVELDGEAIISQAVDLLIERIGEDADITKVLLAFTYSKMQEEKSFNIEANLKKQGLQLLKEDIEKYLIQLKSLTLSDFLHIAETQKSEIQKIKSRIKKIGQDFLHETEINHLTDSDFYQGKRGIYGFFMKMAQFDGEPVLVSKSLQSIVENDTYAKPKASSEIIAQLEGMTPSIQKWIALFQKEQKQYFSKKLLSENIYTVAVLNEINQIIQQQVQEEGIIHISEFNKKISRIILEEPIPFIYERLGEQYQHYLIDEFQDTSVLQWHNLLPLVENGLSQNLFSMIVGDSKQAIYRFRQGEVEQFEQLPLIYQKNDNPFLIGREKALIQHYTSEVLNWNYRSRDVIVNFNNDFFKSIGHHYLNDHYKSIYIGDEKKEDPGVVQIPVKKGGYLSVAFLEKEMYEQTTCENVYLAVKKVLEDGFRMKDICILTRNNKELVVLSEYLSEKKIEGHMLQLTSDESFKISSSPKVRFLMAVLQYIQDPDLQTPQLHILTYLISEGKVTQDQATQFFTSKKELLKDFLEKIGFPAKEIFTFLYTSIYDVCEEIIRIFNLNASPDLYIVSFLNIVQTYGKKNEQNMSAFLKWFSNNENKLSAKSSEELNAIRLMTIHKSKGLGFPVIIYPFADSKCSVNTDLWVDVEETVAPLKTGLITVKKEIELSVFDTVYYEEREKVLLDLINVLYVAFTRAKERLYVFCEKPPEKGDTISYPFMLKQFLQEKGVYSESQTVYELGVQSVEEPDCSTMGEEKSLDIVVSSNWTSRTLLNSRDKTAKELIALEVYAEKGVLLHEALAYVKTIKDSEQAVRKLVLKNLLKEEEESLFLKQLKTFINHPSVSCFFPSEEIVKTESEIFTNNTRFRIDRIIIKKEETLIVDFKSGKKRREDYHQVLNYCQIVRDMGFPHVRGYLIYIDDIPEVIEVLDS